MINYNSIENKATNLLKKLSIKEPPIPIHNIVKELDLQLLNRNFDANISGMLVIKDKKGFIGYNAFEPEVRQRFTIAHELGHFVLHKDSNNIFVDQQFKVLYRDEIASKGENQKEQEANAFAAAILMPRVFIINQIKENGFDLSNDNQLNDFARIFKVSTQAMTYRLTNLKLF